jgi:lysozyme family protein
MIQNFTKSLALVLGSEGGNDDDPEDHGGRTSRGITQREYDAWCAERGYPGGDVWNAKQEDIDAIYRTEYWIPYCDGLPAGVDYMFFDMAVNAGPHRAAVLLQRAARVTADGRIGPITRMAIADTNPATLIARFTAQKGIFYRAISTHPGQRKFLRGWLNRNASVNANACRMLTGA